MFHIQQTCTFLSRLWQDTQNKWSVWPWPPPMWPLAAGTGPAGYGALPQVCMNQGDYQFELTITRINKLYLIDLNKNYIYRFVFKSILSFSWILQGSAYVPSNMSAMCAAWPWTTSASRQGISAGWPMSGLSQTSSTRPWGQVRDLWLYCFIREIFEFSRSQRHTIQMSRPLFTKRLMMLNIL